MKLTRTQRWWRAAQSAAVANAGDPPNYPVVADSVETTSASGTTPSLLVPAHDSSDLLLMFAAMDEDPNISSIADINSVAWVPLSGSPWPHGTHLQFAGWRAVAGSNQASQTSVTLTIDEDQPTVAECVRITGFHASSILESSSRVLGTDGAPDPDSITASWGAEANLFGAVAAHDNANDAISSPPSGYSGMLQVDVGGSGGVGLAIAFKSAVKATDDPGPFTMADTDQWSAMSFVVRPAAA